MFSDLKIAPDLGQLPRSEEIIFNNYILPQTWGKSPVLGEIQLSKVSTHKQIILGKSKSTNFSWEISWKFMYFSNSMYCYCEKLKTDIRPKKDLRVSPNYASNKTHLYNFWRPSTFLGSFSFLNLSSKIANFCHTESFRTKEWGRILPEIHWCWQM